MTMLTQEQRDARAELFLTDDRIKTGVVFSGRTLQHVCFTRSDDSGWWTHPVLGDLRTVVQHPTASDLYHTAASVTDQATAGALVKLLAGALIGQKLALIHSEVSEAMEGDRKGLMDDKLPHRKMLEVELADAAIRIFDLAGALGFDLGQTMYEKLAFNATRADHKLANRAATEGKAY